MLEILQTEESTTKTLSTIGADTQKIHYARYNKKKKCCIKTGKLKKPPNTWNQHIAGAHEPEDMYYDEDGNV